VTARAELASTPQSPPVLLAVGALPPPVNGLSKAFSFVVDGLGEMGWDVEVIDVADRTPLRVGSSFSWARTKAILASLRQVVERARRADVVYLTISQSRFGFAKDLVAINWGAFVHRPVVVHMHGGNFGGFYASLSRAEQALVKSALDRLAAIIVLTPSLKADFAMTRGWQERTVAIANTCDVAAGFVRRPQPGTLRVLYLSTLIASKGYREAIAAAGELARRQPDLRVKIDLAGTLVPERDFSSRAAQAADLYRAVAALPPNAEAVFHGEVGPARKEALLSAADVFVLPTRYVNEGQPIAIIEALTAGLPVVATDWRGIRETLPPAMHSLLVQSPDPQAIADRLAGLVADPAWFEAASRAALDRAADFRPERHLLAVEQVLREARERGAQPGRAVPSSS
jgi:glycosyltransferase involved in cell wall biosynthesis